MSLLKLGTWEGDPQFHLPKPGPGIYSKLLLFVGWVLFFFFQLGILFHLQNISQVWSLLLSHPLTTRDCVTPRIWLTKPQSCLPQRFPKVVFGMVDPRSPCTQTHAPTCHPEHSQFTEITRVYMEEYLICSGRGEGSSVVLFLKYFSLLQKSPFLARKGLI